MCGDGEIGDDELTQLALASDPDAPLPDDAVPFASASGLPAIGLGAWYMPAATSFGLRGWKRPVLLAVVVTLVVLEALGLCSVFGQVVVG